MNAYSRHGISYMNAINPCYTRKRYRPRIHFPDVNAVDVMTVCAALAASAFFVAVFLNWFFGN